MAKMMKVACRKLVFGKYSYSFIPCSSHITSKYFSEPENRKYLNKILSFFNFAKQCTFFSILLNIVRQFYF